MSRESSVTKEAQASTATEQFLTFFLNEEEYGVEILRVQEIRSWSAPMPLPHAPAYIKGVINIRGDIVPIADLRERLGLSSAVRSPTLAVVVLRVGSADRTRTMGVVVDAMSDVTNVSAGDIKAPPDFAGVQQSMAKGIATVAEKMITILDVDQLFEPSAVPHAPA